MTDWAEDEGRTIFAGDVLRCGKYPYLVFLKPLDFSYIIPVRILFLPRIYGRNIAFTVVESGTVHFLGL